MNTNETELLTLCSEIEKKALGPEDTFDFSCDRCGRCCREREDILLNPADLFRIARFLGLPPGEIAKRYCEGYIGSDSRIPVIRLKPKPYRKTCPFLGPEGCSVHAAKPTVCALFPLGRAYIYPKDKLVYFCQDVSCGAKTETHTAREWLAEFGREYEDSDTLAWMKLTPRLSLWMHKHEPSLSETKKQDLWAQMLRLCYLQYDIRQPFTPQFAANTAALLGQMAGA